MSAEEYNPYRTGAEMSEEKQAYERALRSRRVRWIVKWAAGLLAVINGGAWLTIQLEHAGQKTAALFSILVIIGAGFAVSSLTYPDE